MRPRTPSVLLAATLAGVLVLPGGVALAKGGGHAGKGPAPATSTADRPAGSTADVASRPEGRQAKPRPRPKPAPFSLVGIVVSADSGSVTVAVRNASSSVRVLRGRTVQVPVASGTKVLKNGRRVSVARLVKGDKVSIVGVRYGAALVTRLVVASGRWTTRPVTPRPDTVNPSPDTVNPVPDTP